MDLTFFRVGVLFCKYKNDVLSNSRKCEELYALSGDIVAEEGGASFFLF